MKYLAISLFFTLLSCKSQTKKFSIIGEWQQIEYVGSDGAKSYTEKSKNERVFIFEQNNVVKDKSGNAGKYKFLNNNLHIDFFNGNEYYFRLDYDEKDVEKIFLNPLNEKYEMICDEGCPYVFEKIDD